MVIDIFGISLGKIVFLSGIGVFILAVFSSIVFALSAKGQKKRIEKRMREKY